MLKGIKVLVTGAEGFIGSHLTKRLVDESAEVSAFTYSNKKNIEDIKDEIKIYNIDINNFDEVKKAIEKIQPKKIFHLAAFVDVSRTLENIKDIININIKGTLNLLKVLENINYDCFINTGTCEEYGNNPVPFLETQIPNPVSSYSASKVSTTMFCQMLYKTQNIPIITLRPFLTYGPNQNTKMLIPNFIVSALKNERLQMTKGEQTRDIVYVSDIVDAYIKASLSKKAIGEIINIGTGEEVQIKCLVLKILELMNSSLQPEFGALSYRKGETMHFYCNNSKAKELLDWQPKVGLEEGLKKTIEWYQKNV